MLPWYVACLLALAQPRTVGAAPDLVIVNARIWSPDRVGFAQFATVRNGRFDYVGPARDDLAGVRRIDAGGRVVIPGMFDSHVHMLGGGRQIGELQLRNATDRRDFVDRVADRAGSLEPGEWILGGRWSTESWSDPAQPTKEWIDGAAGDHPAFLERMDGHSALVNSIALERAGITADGPPDPPGGVIDRDAQSGAPTGILRESAMGLVTRLIPPITVEAKELALRRAAAHALGHGVTSVSDIPDIDDLDAYEVLARRRPPLRFFLYASAGDWSQASSVRFHGYPGWVELRGLKTYMDGSLGSRTACMREPYLGNEPGHAGWAGLLREDAVEGRLAANLAAARDAGLQPIAHAIGDQANHLLLDALEAVYGADLAAARPRVEHAQHLLPDDIARFGRLGVIASMQPYHKADDGRYAESYIGPRRARFSYAYKALLDTGAVLAFGSDWPVATIDPMLGIEAAVTGRILDGGTWQTQQNITVGEALRGYTAAGAYAVFAENELGRIAPGYKADFVILNLSPFDPDVEWSAIRPQAVFVEGRLMHGHE